jgi:hypothetical protein
MVTELICKLSEGDITVRPDNNPKRDYDKIAKDLTDILGQDVDPEILKSFEIPTVPEKEIVPGLYGIAGSDPRDSAINPIYNAMFTLRVDDLEYDGHKIHTCQGHRIDPNPNIAVRGALEAVIKVYNNPEYANCSGEGVRGSMDNFHLT